MSIESQNQQPLNKPRTNAQAESDDGMAIPGSAPPLSPGRTDVNPDDQAGVDELPGNEVEIPQDSSDDPDGRVMPDIDVDKAEMDDAPDPR